MLFRSGSIGTWGYDSMVSKCFGRLRHQSQAGEAFNLVLLEQPMWWATLSSLVNSEVNKHVFRPFHGLSRGCRIHLRWIRSRRAAAATNPPYHRLGQTGDVWSCIDIPTEHVLEVLFWVPSTKKMRSVDDKMRSMDEKICGADIVGSHKTNLK